MAELVGASAWAAQFLNRHPILLDEASTRACSRRISTWVAFRAELAQQLDEIEPDMERQMDLMREQHHAQVFRLLTRDIAGKLTVERHADPLGAGRHHRRPTVTMCWRKIKNRHRDDPKFAVLAYGKLGGKELGYASDLDMVFVHDDDAPESAGVSTPASASAPTPGCRPDPAGQLFESTCACARTAIPA